MIGNHFAPLPTDLNKQVCWARNEFPRNHSQINQIEVELSLDSNLQTPHRPMKPSAANVNEQEWIQHPIVKSLLDFFYNQFNADGF